MHLRCFALVLALAVAACVHAQTVVPVEQIYGPFRLPQVGTAQHQVAPNGKGALLVWSEALNQQAVIRFGLLDPTARLASEVITIAAPMAADSISPAVATDGNSFLLAWTEVSYLDRYEMPRLMVLRIDPEGHPIGVPRTLHPPAPVYPREYVTKAHWTGTAYEVYGLQGSHFRVHPDDRVEDLSPGEAPYASIGNESFRAGWMPITWTPPCGWWWCPRETRWVLVWSTGGGSLHEYSPIRARGLLTAAGGGRVQLVGWMTTGGIALVRIQDARVISEELIASDARHATPGVAFDGTRYLFAYLSEPEVLSAMLISSEGEVIAQFPIAQGIWVNDIDVDAIGAGRFLISYRTRTGESAIRGAIVVTEPARRRAIR